MMLVLRELVPLAEVKMVVPEMLQRLVYLDHIKLLLAILLHQMIWKEQLVRLVPTQVARVPQHQVVMTLGMVAALVRMAQIQEVMEEVVVQKEALVVVRTQDIRINPAESVAAAVVEVQLDPATAAMV